MGDVMLLDKIKELIEKASLSSADDTAAELADYLSSGDGFEFLQVNNASFSLSNVWIYSLKVSRNSNQNIVINGKSFTVDDYHTANFPESAAAHLSGPVVVENIHNTMASGAGMYYGVIHILYKPAM